jgi:hypothetical protein
MSRKTTSNTAFKPTIWQEIYKHYEVYFDLIARKCTSLLKAYPRTIFTGMIISILLSIGCFFFIPRKIPSETSPTSSIIGSMQTSISGLASTASVMKELLALNGLIENVVKKESLNQQDSIFLIQALERMQILEKSLVTQNNPPTINDK